VSYSFTVVSDDEGVRVVGPRESMPHVPHGTFTVNGHEPAPGMSKVASLGVTFFDEKHQHVQNAAGTRVVS